MSTRITALTPSLSSAPGERSIARVEIHNEGSADAVYNVAVVGIEPSSIDEQVPATPVSVSVPAGGSAVAEVPVVVPRSLGVGQHAAAFEVTSDRPADRPALSPFTLSISSMARVDVEPQPATIRARRRAKFQVDLTNREPEAVALTVDAAAADVDIDFSLDTFSLLPGQRATAKAKLKGPRQWTGEPTQHNIVITARGRASSTTATAAYVQRPLFAHKLRMALAALTVIALWLGAIGGVAFWLANRDDGGQTSSELVGVDTDGDGIPDTFFDADGNPVSATDTDGDGIPDLFVDADGNPIPGTDTDGDGIPDTLVDANGNPIGAIDTDGDGVPDQLSDGSGSGDTADGAADEQADAPPTSTVLRGTVTAQGDPSDISIRMAPIELGSQPEAQTAALGFAGSGSTTEGGKLWSARYGRLDASTGPVRQTEAVPPLEAIPDGDGIWLFTDVAVRQTYELVFAKPGFDTQSFVVTPPEDGSPVELDVELVPASGAASGRITGPGGALGGVAIVVSDGTLTFETTSATDGDIGAWSLDGLSTPGVYTLTATQRGFGTEVIQITLGAGEQRTGINLAMRPGVGSVSGRVVDERGQPLPGATVTATTGETALTTSTLTEGAIGTYNLPQLAVPDTYTVKVELDGYITQTRRVPLAGALPSVDFVMNRTTLDLSGRVTSSEGGGIVGAGVTITTGDLQFRTSTGQQQGESAGSVDDPPPTSTAAAPDPGTFSIDDLPPGVYAITFEHFEHETVTEFITLTAGVPPPPVNVTMQATDGPPDVGTGSLVVTVLDNDPLADPQGIVGATVTLTRNRTADKPIEVTDPASSNVRIENLAVGTYTVRVSAPGFNASIPQQVSVGLNEERREIRLQELGQANGTVIDSISGDVLTDYQITIYEVRPIGEFLVGTFREQGGQWQTPPDVLRTGTYRVEIRPEDAPTGYLVREDQTLDPLAGATMQFVVPIIDEATVEPLTVSPIEADPYPELSGRVFRPVLDGTTVEFEPIDDARLTATAECNGQSVDNVIVRDTDGLQDGTRFDEFFIDKGNVAKAIRDATPSYQLPASCSVTVAAADGSATDYEPLTFDISGVDVSNGATLSDRRVNSALVQPVESLSGTVFWVDGNASADPPPLVERLPLDGTAIAARAVVADFAPREATLADTELKPTTVPADIAVTSNGSGGWSAPGQIFGQSNYTFTEDGFGPGTITVRIDEGGRTVTQGSGVRLNPEGGGFAVELFPPEKGQISGNVTILTRSPDANHPDLVETTNPFGAAPPASDVAVNVTTNATTNTTTAAFTVSNADPGTWQARFDPPANHDFLPSATPTTACEEPWCVEQQVGPFPTPTTTAAGFDTTLVELGAVQVRLFDQASSPSTATPLTIPAELTVTMLSAVGSTTDPTYSGSALPEAPPGAGDAFRIERLPVNAAAPTNNVVTYSLDVEVPQWDDSALKNLSFSIRAGETATIDLFVEPFGGIEGDVFGQQSADPTDLVELTGPETSLLVRRVTSDGGTILPTTEFPVAIDASGGYAFSAEPGFYKLQFSNGAFLTDTPISPVGDPLNPLGTAGVFEVRNDTTNLLGDFVFDKIKGQLTVSATTALTGGTTVSGAVYDIFDDCSTNPTAAGTIVSSAAIALYPGTYCLKVNKYDPYPTRVAFPAVATITFPDAVGNTPPTLAVIAPLPAIAPSLTGTIRAENELGAPVSISDCSSLYPTTQLESTYDGTLEVSVGGANETNEESPNRTANVVAGATAGTCTYSFTEMVTGTHTISVPLPSGLDHETPSAANPTFSESVTGGIGAENGADIVYQVPSADVTVTLDDGAAGATFEDDALTPLGNPTLTPPGTGTSPINGTLSGSTVTFSNVAYLDGDFALSVPTPLHGTVTASKALPRALVNNVRDLGQLTATPALTRFQGTVRQLDLGSAVSDLAATGTLTLTRTDGALSSCAVPANDTSTSCRQTGPLIDPANSSNTSFFRFDVTPGTYSLQVVSDGYATRTFNNIDLTGAGRVVEPADAAVFSGSTVDIEKQVVIEVNVTNLSDLENPAITLRQGSASILPTSGTNTFVVPPGTYAVRITADNYPTFDRDPETYPRGDTDTISITLPRRVRVTVTGASTAKVELRNSASAVIGTINERSTGDVFEFSSETITGMTGALDVRVTSTATPSVRPQVVDAGSDLFAAPNVSLRPLAQVTGTINAPDSSATPTNDELVSATDGTTTLRGVVSSGSYTITGLTAGADGTSKSWTIAYDQVGVGTSAPVATVDVSGNSANSVTRDLTVTAQALTVPFKVTEAGSDPVKNVGSATVTFGGAAQNTIGNGTTTFTTVLETATLGWSVAADDYYIESGSVTLGTSRTVAVVPVALTPRDPIAGRVVTGATPTPVDGATVRICASSATTICTTGLYPDQLSAATTGAYSFAADVAAGSYTIFATKTTGTGTSATTATGGPITLVVGDDRRFTLTPSSGEISIS